jgi:hypothetical protein
MKTNNLFTALESRLTTLESQLNIIDQQMIMSVMSDDSSSAEYWAVQYGIILDEFLGLMLQKQILYN